VRWNCGATKWADCASTSSIKSSVILHQSRSNYAYEIKFKPRWVFFTICCTWAHRISDGAI
jgi:hypothetical protein